MTSLQSFVMGDVLFLTGVTLFFLIAYWVGRADILRRIWKRVRGRERVKYTLTFERSVREGEAYPRGYGFAYYEYRWDAKVAYPIPFNLVVRGVRRIYLWYLEWFVGGARGNSKWDRMLMKARVNGWHEGRAQGRKDGLETGLKKGRRQGYNKGHNDGFEEGWQEYRDGVLAQLNIRVADKGEESDFPTLEGFETVNDDNPPQ